MSVFYVIDRIEAMSPCAAVRYRIKRMRKQEIEPELFDEFYNGKRVELLKTNQHADGGFGRFHTRDSKLKQKIPTTEHAVNSIKMLDIPRGNSLVDRLCDYMEKILRREIEWPDGFEKNVWYKPAQPLFVASKLSVFGSDCKELTGIFRCWHTVLKEAFSEGEYDKDRANKAAKDLLGCSIDGSYIGLNSVYPMELFGNMEAIIDEELKRNYLKWLRNSGKNICYTNVVLNRVFQNDFSELYRVYFLLSRFSCFKTEFEEELSILKDRRNKDGFWNFGKEFSCQRLSDDRRNPNRMMIDHTIMALLLYL
jgi:hypothetical protein